MSKNDFKVTSIFVKIIIRICKKDAEFLPKKYLLIFYFFI